MAQNNHFRVRQKWIALASLAIVMVGIFITWLRASNHLVRDTIAIKNVNLIPMTSEVVVQNQTILIRDSIIIQMGASDQVKIPSLAQVIDGRGLYLMPGLADMHAHTCIDWDDRKIWPVNPVYLYLANGVTTIRDLSAHGYEGTYPMQLKEAIRSGTLNGPTIYTSGEMFYSSPLGNPKAMVRRNHELGYDLIKLYSYLSKDDFQEVMTASKELGMYTSGHIPYTVGLDGVLTSGMDEISHVEEFVWEFFGFDRNRHLTPEEWSSYLLDAVMLKVYLSNTTLQSYFEVNNAATLETIAEKVKNAGVAVCTTLVVDEIIRMKLFEPEAFLSRPENKFLESGYLESFSRGEEYHQLHCQDLEELCAFKRYTDRWILKGLHEAGVLLVLGSDAISGMGIVPGYSVHDELRILVESGLTPYEAIQTGTVNAAIVVDKMIGEGNFGTIEVGNRADLVLVADNPLKDLSPIKEPLGVMASGKWYSQEELAELIVINGSPEIRK